MPSFRLLAPALFALAVCGTPPAASAQSFSDTQRGDIETIVKNYLISHPEVLEEAMAELSKRQAAAETEKHEASIAKNGEAIFNSPRGVTLGNKDGDVTFVEFFDYNCGYCKRAMADMLDLMKADPKLKVVLKEFPVLSEGSVEAAKVAVAVRMQDPGGKKYLDFHQKLLGGRGAARLNSSRLKRTHAKRQNQITFRSVTRRRRSLNRANAPSSCRAFSIRASGSLDLP